MTRKRSGAEFAVAYDLSDDHERRRVNRLLIGFGFRVQKSVFECRLTRSGHAALLRALEALELSTGSVRIYRILGSAQHVRVIGQRPGKDSDDGLAFTW